MDVRHFKIKDGPVKPYVAIPNARFWIPWRGTRVKITVPINEELSLYEGGDHEEGWERCFTVFKHEGTRITRSIYVDGCDCDGRYGRESHSHIDFIEMLRPSRELSCGTMTPNWRAGEYENRDYEAEKAGY